MAEARTPLAAGAWLWRPAVPCLARPREAARRRFAKGDSIDDSQSDYHRAAGAGADDRLADHLRPADRVLYCLRDRRGQRRGRRFPGAPVQPALRRSAPISIRSPTRRCWCRSTFRWPCSTRSRSGWPSSSSAATCSSSAAVVLSWMLDQPIEMRPLAVSKVNTVAQIVLAAVVLGDLAFVGRSDGAAHGAGLSRRRPHGCLGGGLSGRLGAPHGHGRKRRRFAVRTQRGGSPIVNRQTQVALFWLGALAVLVLALFVLRQILLPFVVGMALAYALDPGRRLAAAARLQPHGRDLPDPHPDRHRVRADLRSGRADRSSTSSSTSLSACRATSQKLQGMLGPVLDSECGALPRHRCRKPAHVAVRVPDAAAPHSSRRCCRRLWTGGARGHRHRLAVCHHAVRRLLHAARLGPADRPGSTAFCRATMPTRSGSSAAPIDDKVAAFVRGQMLSGLVLGMFYAVGLVAIGLNFGLLIGLAAGIMSFIPYVGFAVGFTVSILIALVQFWPDWIWIAATVGVFMVGQVLEGYILQPLPDRHARRPASGLAAVLAVRLWPSVRLRRPADRDSRRGGGRRAAPLRDPALSGEQPSTAATAAPAAGDDR